MKKVLIASTALVAAGLMTTGTASASEKIKLELGGFSKWWVVGQWQDNNYLRSQAASATNAISPTNVDVKGDNEIHFNGSTTLDNGMKVGVRIELEAGGHTDQTSDVIDESYAYIETGFGKVLVGTYNNGTYLLHVSAPDAAGNWGEAALAQSGITIARPAAVSQMMGGSTTAIATDGDADKITYVAPSFYGLTVGASYVPNALSEDSRAVGAVATGAAADAATNALLSDVSAYGAGALYANTFGGVGVKLSAGWVTYDMKAASDQNHEYSAGAQLSYAGFTLGGSFRRSNVNEDAGGTLSTLAAAGYAGTTSTSGGNGNLNPLAQEGRAFDVGVQYAAGPYAVSFAYFNSKTAGSDTNTAKDKIDIYQVSGKYTLGAGVDVLASAGYAKFRDEAGDTTANAAGNNDGWYVGTALSLAF